MVSNPAVASADCLPSDQQWRKDLESQTQALQSRLSSVEQELTTTRQSLIAVNGALTSSNQKMAELNQEVKHWQGTTQQLESEMKRQQESDLKSLDELSGTLSQLLDRQRALEQGR
jgi:chromosome segregation ATPase